MTSIISFALQNQYKKVKALRSRLEEMHDLIDWNKFLKLFPTKENKAGRNGYAIVLKLKCLFLQAWYSISDEELEYQINDRVSFQQFLDFPNTVPDYSTIWRFREYLTEADLAEKIWCELQRQIEARNLKIEKGVIQDASFVRADPGKKNSGMNGRGREAKTSRSADGSWTKKGKESIFGFKLHTKVDDKHKIITEVGLTTASTFDGHVDLAKEDEINYRDRGYSGVPTKAKGDGTMKKGKLTPRQKLRNKRIAKKRCRVEHPYATIHRSFKGGRTKLTTLARVFVQQLFVCAAYNVHRLRFLLSS